MAKGYDCRAEAHNVIMLDSGWHAFGVIGRLEKTFRVFTDPVGHPFCIVFGHHGADWSGSSGSAAVDVGNDRVVLIDHLVYRAPDLARAVADVGEVAGMQRAAPAGAVLRWRLTLRVMPGGLVPFLISWGDTEHPALSAPRGLTLESFHLEHPDPASVAPMLTALDADAEIMLAAAPALVARLSGPNGSTVLH
jgi:Glyoxalase-like domain